jgi:hypothetical protein
MNFEQFIKGLSKEQKEALVESLMAQEPIEYTKEEPNKKVNDDFRVTSTKNNVEGKRGVPVKFKGNQWFDDGEEAKDVKTPKINPTPREREKAKKVEVECHVCGKTFYEDPRYVYGEYLRCSRCGKR